MRTEVLAFQRNAVALYPVACCFIFRDQLLLQGCVEWDCDWFVALRFVPGVSKEKAAVGELRAWVGWALAAGTHWRLCLLVLLLKMQSHRVTILLGLFLPLIELETSPVFMSVWQSNITELFIFRNSTQCVSSPALSLSLCKAFPDLTCSLLGFSLSLDHSDSKTKHHRICKQYEIESQPK